MHIKKLLAALILCLSVVATPVGAAPMEDENPCDPDNGKYICDGTQDWPNGDCPPELCGPKLPSTGVSDPSDDLSAMTGDDGVSSSVAMLESSPSFEWQEILQARREASMIQPLATAPTSSYLPRNHQAQQHNNWCGPASMSMALDHMGVSRTQSQLASASGIGTSGLGVGLGTMQRVLNNIGASHGFAWDIQSLPFTPSSSDKATYRSRLVSSINGYTGSGKQYPLIVNFRILKSGSRPTGYPTGREIRHHVEVRGYKESGTWTQIQDPATSVWSGVQAHYPYPSDKVVVMAGDRGYLY